MTHQQCFWILSACIVWGLDTTISAKYRFQKFNNSIANITGVIVSDYHSSHTSLLEYVMLSNMWMFIRWLRLCAAICLLFSVAMKVKEISIQVDINWMPTLLSHNQSQILAAKESSVLQSLLKCWQHCRFLCGTGSINYSQMFFQPPLVNCIGFKPKTCGLQHFNH